MRMDGLHGRGRNGKLIGLTFCSLILACFAVSASAQPSSEQLVRICVLRNLIESEGWEHSAPGSRIQLFRNLIRDYLLGHGDAGNQYRIKENAFAHFEPGRTTARDILQVVSAKQEYRSYCRAERC
jgi:hypothetical protein